MIYMRFFKDAFSSFWVHLGASIVAFIFCYGLGVLFDGWGFAFVIPIILIVYSIPIFIKFKSLGQRDKNSNDFGHTKRNPFRGIIIALAANSLNILMGLLLIPAKAELIPNFVMLFRFTNPQISPIMLLIQNSVYLPDFSWLHVILYALLTLIPVFLAGFFYLLGLHDFSFKDKIVYKNN